MKTIVKVSAARSDLFMPELSSQLKARKISCVRVKNKLFYPKGRTSFAAMKEVLAEMGWAHGWKGKADHCSRPKGEWVIEHEHGVLNLLYEINR